jgi:transcriptional regulator with XRE-family HTH domain
MTMAESFGAQLRRRRVAAGISIGELARRINYSKSYVSKIENDIRSPTSIMARLCDRALDAGGELTALVAPVQPEGSDNPEEMELERPAATVLGHAAGRGSLPLVDEHVIAGMRASFDQLRALGRIASPMTVLPQAIALADTLRVLTGDNPEPIRGELLWLASRVAEYVGWMSQEAGDDRGALWWTERAVRFATDGRNPQLASWALVRRAEIALYQQDALSIIELSRRAQRDRTVSPRILGQAARCEAQGHALAGDLDNHQRALDRAARLLTEGDPADDPVTMLGSASVDNQISLTQGWSLFDLGRPAEGAAVLDRQTMDIPETARRARARFGARRALAHAYSGEVDHACVLTPQVLDDAVRVDSATVRTDLRQLARIFSRYRDSTLVNEIYPDLARAIGV